MIFQSRYKQHTIVMRSATYEQIPGLQRAKLVPQIVATFTGNQRLFNSETAQRENAWSDEDRLAMEDWLFNHPKYMIDFFVAPGQEIPEQYKEQTYRREPEKPRICERFEFVDNDIIRCPNPVSAGRNFCAEHDGSKQTILQGSGGSGDVGLATTLG